MLAHSATRPVVTYCCVRVIAHDVIKYHAPHEAVLASTNMCELRGGGEAKQLGFFTIAQVVKILMQKLALARYVNFIPFIIYRRF